MVRGGPFPREFRNSADKVKFHVGNIPMRCLHFVVEIVNFTKGWVSRDRSSITLILDNELLGFSQPGGFWRPRSEFIALKLASRGFM